MDVVITYVNITDRFKEQYSKYVKKELEENRFRSYDTLELQVKGIRKYLPYIENIFIVVSELEQVQGLDLSDCKIITHDQIIPQKYLPCFNSCTIEMFLHKISGLSEQFLYFNDDMFIIDNVPYSYWFKDNKPCLSPQIYDFDKENNINTFNTRCYNSTQLAASNLKLSNKYKDKLIKQAHCPKPYLKSTCERVFNKNILYIFNSLTRTRHSKNYNCYLFNDYDYISSNCNIIERNYLYFENESLYNIINSINDKEKPIICVNDNNYVDFNKFKLEFKNIINANLDNKKYNLPQKIVVNNSKILSIKNNKINNKKVIYTCITGNYDNLIEPKVISEGFDYICFTDDLNLKSNIWEIREIPDNLKNLSKVKQQRNIKINPHKYLYKYDLSIWVDSSVELKADVNDVLQSLDFSKYNIFITKHPERNCIYEEGKACIELKKDTPENINSELNFFKDNGMPENFGLLETNVIIRLHNDLSCIQLMKRWSKYLNMFSHRDQLSLPFCLWELKYTKLFELPKGFNHTKYFNWIGGLHKKINICIIHYNTPELTNALIKSINKYTKRAIIYLFDNSTYKPFNYEYDNLIYLDNTQGQYINFDKWLEQYPTRFLSKESIGNYGSARHSISVQKCIELIDENFILMDSDILLKRDIKGFVNKKYIYVGQSELQKNGLYRVLPYCLFINVDMCKKYNVPWFDENYMHGLHITKQSDRYDTGGAFYVHTRDLPYHEVNLDSFIVHYKGGSWEERHMKKYGLTLTSKEWLEINKKYWSN